MHRLIPKKPQTLIALIGASLVLFELMHRLGGFPQILSSTILGILVLPILLLGIVQTVAGILAEPDRLTPLLRDAVVFIVLTVLFFAVLYTELGILENRPPYDEVRGFWVCLYFSVATLTTLGYGDFVPTPEARFIAVIEALLGYLVLGIITAAFFFLIAHHSRKKNGGGDSPL